MVLGGAMGEWGFLTNHARALLFIANDPDAILRDMANALGVTERTAYGIVADLTEAGYVVKEREGRRNRLHIQTHLPLRGSSGRGPTVDELLSLFTRPKSTRKAPPRAKQKPKPKPKVR
jgi:hypothetical protein